MRCAICDDDFGFLRAFQPRVEAHCAARGIAAECRLFLTPSEFLLAGGEGFDIVFLNVDMGCWDGINMARRIRRAGGGPLVILVSAHVQFAPRGYEVGAFRYLMKQELDESFAPAMNDALARLGAAGGEIEIRRGRECHQVPVESIVYAESDKRVVRFHLRDYEPEQLSCYMKLTELENRLASRGFLRIHKSFLVNMREVGAMRNYCAHLSDGTVLQASRANYRQLVRQLESWRRAAECGKK